MTNFLGAHISAVIVEQLLA